MKNKPSHFAIYIDNMDRAKKFYQELFGWEFNSFGPPDFFQIRSDSQLIGALQSRSYAHVKEKVIGFECTISVEDIDNTIEKVLANGGKIVLPKTSIPTVGWITKFLDSEENLVCAMQYDTA
ncbi:MAG: VOC family protein [Cyclobacteriaceae bacterium]